MPSCERAKAAGVPLTRLGATGGGVLAIAGERPLPVDDLKQRFEAWLPAYMAGAHSRRGPYSCGGAGERVVAVRRQA